MYKKVGESTNWDRLFQTLLIGRSHSTALRSTTHHHPPHYSRSFVMRAANLMTATTIKPSNGGKRKETDDTMVDKTNEEKRLKVTKRKKKTDTSLRATTTATPSADGNEGNTSVMILNTSDQSGEKPSDDAVLSQPLASSTPEKNTLGFLLR